MPLLTYETWRKHQTLSIDWILKAFGEAGHWQNKLEKLVLQTASIYRWRSGELSVELPEKYPAPFLRVLELGNFWFAETKLLNHFIQRFKLLETLALRYTVVSYYNDLSVCILGGIDWAHDNLQEVELDAPGFPKRARDLKELQNLLIYNEKLPCFQKLTGMWKPPPLSLSRPRTT